MIPSQYHYSYSHKMPYSKIEGMGNMTTGWQMHKITRATHLPKPHITGSEVCERGKLKAGCLLQGSSLSASKICNCNQSSDARAGFCAVLFNFCPHTHTHTSPAKHQNRLYKKIRAKSASLMKDPFSFTGLFPYKLEKQSPSTQQNILYALHINFQYFHNVFFNRAL